MPVEMDEKRKNLLLNADEMGYRFYLYLTEHGIVDDAGARKAGLTNFSRYKNRQAGVSWDAIIKVAHYFKVDPTEIVDHLDPGPKERPADIKITGKNRPAFEMLDRILRDAPKRVVDGIVVNLEQFCTALDVKQDQVLPSGGGSEETKHETDEDVAPRATDRRATKGRRKDRRKSAASHSPPGGRTAALG